MPWTRLGTVIFILTVASLGGAQDTPKKDAGPSAQTARDDKAVNWMQIKLRSSQEILAALTSGDAEKVHTNARRLLVMNFLEQWVRKDDFTKKSEYEGELNRFEFATKELIRFGKAGDIDGSLDAYQTLCRSCVECHKLIRDK